LKQRKQSKKSFVSEKDKLPSSYLSQDRQPRKIWKIIWALLVLLVISPFQSDIRNFYLHQWLLMKFRFGDKPIITVLQSTFNNMFTLTKSHTSRDSIIVNGVNTTHKLGFRVRNISDEPLYIKYCSVYDPKQELILYSKAFKENDYFIASRDSSFIVMESPSLFGRDDLVRIIENGKLLLLVETNFGSLTQSINCVCLFNGQKMPNGKCLYTIGTDTSCIVFEYTDAEAIAAKDLSHCQSN
jgi:hypothetical protein